MRFGEAGEGVELDLTGGIADVRLDRPEKLNALSPTMFAAIACAIDYLAEEEDLRCVVLSGIGRSFCSGLDLASFTTGIGPLSPRTKGIANDPQHCAWGWRELPVPVIAALHGHVFGAGLQIAFGADLRIATPDAQLSIMEMKHGLAPDLGAFVLSRGVVREDQFRELVYTARIVSGAEALPLGLVTRMAGDPHADAMKLAAEIAAKSPDAIRAAKRLAGMMGQADEAAILQAESDEAERLIAAMIGGNGS